MTMMMLLMMSLYLSDLFDGLKGIQERWEEVGKDRQEVDDVHEAFYELPPGIIMVEIIMMISVDI